MHIPGPSEYPEGFGTYISLVLPHSNTFDELLQENGNEVAELFGNIPEALHDYRYADGKWSVKEVLTHITDTERIFAYRALVCIRGDAVTPLHRMDENLYAANADVRNRTLQSLIHEFKAVRQSTAFLFEGITDAQSRFPGNFVPDKISAAVLGYAIAGHAAHHIHVMKERYLAR